ncbi:hypothetical protein Adt_08312 [Abeliophyllum distichum]|uniref:EF-hand domain-containing protein n=1 Tax=Abeliophyllum distichum TaxID=126358 RepID=A0ABD1VC93_9LAMI
MGQSLKKMGNEDNKNIEIGPVIEECYEKYFQYQKWESLPEFYHAVCQAVEEINKKFGSTQFRVPKITTLEHAFNKHHQDKGKSLTKEEFQKILQEIIMDTGVTGIGAKDMLFYMFGVPSTALLIKQKLIPKVIPNEIFIPVVTSATVFLLAKLNKI